MIKEVNALEFAEELSEGLVLADFFSQTCGPCKMLGFILRDVEKEIGDAVKILKVDFDKNGDLIKAYQVTGYPTMILFKNGNELARMQGLQQKTKIFKLIDENK
ncbi:MAG: thioredoxin domain-containing protein [Hungatella sp.]